MKFVKRLFLWGWVITGSHLLADELSDLLDQAEDSLHPTGKAKIETPKAKDAPPIKKAEPTRLKKPPVQHRNGEIKQQHQAPPAKPQSHQPSAKNELSAAAADVGEILAFDLRKIKEEQAQSNPAFAMNYYVGLQQLETIRPFKKDDDLFSIQDNNVLGGARFEFAAHWELPDFNRPNISPNLLIASSFSFFTGEVLVNRNGIQKTNHLYRYYAFPIDIHVGTEFSWHKTYTLTFLYGFAFEPVQQKGKGQFDTFSAISLHDSLGIKVTYDWKPFKISVAFMERALGVTQTSSSFKGRLFLLGINI